MPNCKILRPFSRLPDFYWKLQVYHEQSWRLRVDLLWNVIFKKLANAETSQSRELCFALKLCNAGYFGHFQYFCVSTSLSPNRRRRQDLSFDTSNVKIGRLFWKVGKSRKSSNGGFLIFGISAITHERVDGVNARV